MRIKENGGSKCNFKKCNVNTKVGHRLPPHVASDFGDGTVEGEPGEVLYGVG